MESEATSIAVTTSMADNVVGKPENDTAVANDVVSVSYSSHAETVTTAITTPQTTTNTTAVSIESGSSETTSSASESSVKVTEFVEAPSFHIKYECGSEGNNSLVMTNLNEENGLDLLDTDPMDLLELQQRRNTDSDNGSLDGGKFKTPSWLAKYSEWLRHEEDEGPYAYCIYCDCSFNIRDRRAAVHHANSSKHISRKQNYLAYKADLKNKRRAGLIKQEAQDEDANGNSSDTLAELKYKRRSLTQAINDYNWSIWLKQYTWLQRGSEGGTIGMCKYCRVNLNVESHTMRERHQETGKHRLNLEAHIRRQSRNYSCESNEEHSSSGGGGGDSTCVGTGTESEDQNALLIQMLTENPYYRIISQDMWCCTLCDVQMNKHNFRKHLTSNVHIERLSTEKEVRSIIRSSRSPMVEGEGLTEESPDTPTTLSAHDWSIYKDSHPWIMANPTDPTQGYCKYCQRVILNLRAPSNRLKHENTNVHRECERLYHERRNGNASTENAEEHKGPLEVPSPQATNENYVEHNSTGANEGNDVNNEDKSAESEEGDDDFDDTSGTSGNAPLKDPRATRFTPEWLRRYPWCRKNPNDPNYVYCIYCKIPLLHTVQCAKHERTARHRLGQKEHLIKSKTFKGNKIRGVKAYKPSALYPWCIRLNSETIFCTYCRKRLTAWAKRSLHEKSKNHRACEEIYKEKNRSRPGTQRVIQTLARKSLKMANSKFATKSHFNWKNKFPWLIFKEEELRAHYGYCRYCEQAVYVISPKLAARHQRSGTHIKARLQLKKRNIQQGEGKLENTETTNGDLRGGDTLDDGNTETIVTQQNWEQQQQQQQQTPPRLEKMETGYDAENYPWIAVDNENPDKNFAYCKYCEVRLLVKHDYYKERHQASSKHRVNEHLYKQRNMKQRPPSEDEAVATLATNTSMKSKLLTKTRPPIKRNNSDQEQSENDEDPNDNNDSYSRRREFQSRKRPKYGYKSQKEIAQRLTAAHLEILRLVKSFSFNGDDEAASTSSQLQHSRTLDSPLALASRLSQIELPQIKRQRKESMSTSQSPLPSQTPQQQATQQQTSQPALVQPTVLQIQQPLPQIPLERNTFDLFFESVSATVKNLPYDLAVEGRAKVMQIIYDLEVRAFKRKQQSELSLTDIEVPQAVTIASTTTTLPELISTPEPAVVAPDLAEIVRGETVNNAHTVTVDAYPEEEQQQDRSDSEDDINDVIILDSPPPSDSSGEGRGGAQPQQSQMTESSNAETSQQLFLLGRQQRLAKEQPTKPLPTVPSSITVSKSSSTIRCVPLSNLKPYNKSSQPNSVASNSSRINLATSASNTRANTTTAAKSSPAKVHNSNYNYMDITNSSSNSTTKNSIRNGYAALINKNTTIASLNRKQNNAASPRHATITTSSNVGRKGVPLNQQVRRTLTEAIKSGTQNSPLIRTILSTRERYPQGSVGNDDN